MSPEKEVPVRSDERPGVLRAHPHAVRTLAVGAALLVVGSLLLAIAPAALAASPPTIVVSPTSGIVSSAATVSGTGFPASTTVEVWFNDSGGTTDELSADVPVGASGTFSYDFDVPAATNGTATVAAFESGATASASFVVVSHQSMLTAAAPGTVITVAATGFDALADVTYTFGTMTPAGTCDVAVTDITGDFGCHWRVPLQPYGTYPATATDNGLNAASNTVEFQIVPGGGIGPGSGFVGSSIVVMVDGFPAYAPLSIIWDPGLSTSTVLRTTLTSAIGTAATTVTVPVAVHGLHSVEVYYSSKVLETFSFTVLGSLTLAPDAGYVGEAGISAVGEGLPGAATVTVLWDPGTAVQSTLGSATTLANGTFALSFVVPSASRGVHAVSADISAVAMANATFAIDLSNLSLSPLTGPPGGGFAAAMTGFAATSASNVVWDLGLLTQSLLGNGTTSDRGALTLSGLVVPATAAPGPHTVTGIDAADNRASATFIVGPWLTLTPAAGAVGSSFQANGSTFPSGHAILLYWNSTSGPLLATVPALSGASGYPYGNFTVSLTVPMDVYGPHTVVAVVSGTSIEASATFSIVPSLTLSVTQGPVATPVTATAEGLAPFNLSTLSIDAVVTGLGGVTNGTGTVVFPFAMPPEAAGVHALTVADMQGDVTNVANFTIVPSIAVTPTTVYPGEPVTVNLNGFAAFSQATVAWDGNGTATTVPTAADGSALGVVFPIPTTASAGEHNVSAWDLAGNIASPVPVTVLALPYVGPILPVSGAMLNHSVVALSWSPAPTTDVNYTVEISNTSNFASGTSTVAGISGTEWTTPPLPDGTYYWRVEAVVPGGGTAGYSFIGHFLIDTVAPTSTIGALPSHVVGLDLAIPYTATDPAPASGVVGVALYYSSDNGHDWVAFDNGTLFNSSPIAFHAPFPGVYEFQTVAVDGAGNHQAMSSVGHASVVFEPLAVSPNYTPYVFVVSLIVLGVIGWAFLWRKRGAKRPTSAPRPWTEEAPAAPAGGTTPAPKAPAPKEET